MFALLTFFSVTFLAIAIAVVIGSMTLQKGTTPETQIGVEEDSALLRTEQLSTISIWHALLEKFDFAERMQKQILQAELNWSVGRLTLSMLLAGTLSLAALWPIKFIPHWAPLAVSAIGCAAPWAYVLWKRNRRFRKLQENLPDALDSMSRAMRAGYPFGAALEMVVSEAAPPVSTEMRKMSAEVNLGMPWSQALENLCKRVPLAEVHLFAAAVQLHSRTGGKLSEVLQQLAENMRESVALEGEVRALSAHGKLTGYILTALPFFIGGLMLFVSPTYMNALFAHPSGGTLITAAVICLVLAQIVIRKIVDIKL
jgi:tight adherence protein B